VVITGVSGSGKSSLAFDTIYAEGPAALCGRAFPHTPGSSWKQMEKPQVDQITGLSPAIAIEQKSITRNPPFHCPGRSPKCWITCGVLYARLGIPHCPRCGKAVQTSGAQQITDQLAALPEGRASSCWRPWPSTGKKVPQPGPPSRNPWRQGFAPRPPPRVKTRGEKKA